ncbi:MAG TPA: NAD(+) synthase [Bacteroidetes bacterium]|nr:NAD(+) synthase [Bacteroidota bacterium]
MKEEKIAEYITEWLRDYLRGSGSRGYVVGVSGGVDSALVSTLCARTGAPLWCLTLPIHQASSHVSRAQEQCAFLTGRYDNVRTQEVDLTGAFDVLAQVLPRSGNREKDDMALANTRSRLRMTALYQAAAVNGALVAGTGNKIEDFGVGFFTKWGDGGVDLSPIGDLTKTQVYALAAFLGVPRSILEAEPSDGLFENDRTDQMQIGATYPELEWAMDRVNEGRSAADFEGRQAEVMRIYAARHAANAHKMNPIPVCKIPEDFLRG